MADAPTITHPLLRLGQLPLPAALRALQPAQAPADLVVTATVPVPDSSSEPQYAWDVAWADTARQASQLGADEATAAALPGGSGDVTGAPPGGTRVVVAQRGQVLLACWLAADAEGTVAEGTVAEGTVQVGPLPSLLPAASAAARRPAYVVVQASREGTEVIAHSAGDQQPATRFPASDRPGAQADPHPGRPPALHHGERHLTDSEPISGGQSSDEFIAGRVADAAASVGAHIVLSTGDQHILDTVASHLPGSLRPFVPLAAGDRAAAEGAALDQVTAEAISAVGDLIAAGAGAQAPSAVRGIAAVARQLAQEQVAVLLVSADAAAGAGTGYHTGTRPTEFLAGADADGTGVEVPLVDGLTWAALAQDAVVIQLPDRSGPLAGEPAAALLRRAQAG